MPVYSAIRCCLSGFVCNFWELLPYNPFINRVRSKSNQEKGREILIEGILLGKISWKFVIAALYSILVLTAILVGSFMTASDMANIMQQETLTFDDAVLQFGTLFFLAGHALPIISICELKKIMLYIKAWRKFEVGILLLGALFFCYS